MKKEKFTRVIIAVIPLALVLLLVMGYVTSLRTYILCEGGNNCTSISKSLENFLVLHNPEKPDPIPNDATEEIRKKGIKKYERYAAIYGGRITWTFFRMTYLISCLAALAVACAVIYKSFSYSKRAIIWVLGALGLSTVYGIYLYKHPGEYMSVLIPIFERTIGKDLSNIAEVMTRVNSFGFAVCLTVLLATCAILYPDNDGTSPAGLKQLSTKMKYLRLILYVGTVMLVVGILLIRSMYQWSLAFILLDEQAIKVADRFYSDLLSAEGGFFTLILAAVYLPTALILRNRAESLTDLPEQKADREKLLQDYSLTFSFTESLPKLLVILGPLLTGLIGNLFTGLPKP